MNSQNSHESFETQWRRRFEEFASEREDDAGIAGWSASGLAARIRNFARAAAHVRAGTHWLDVGCGAGTYSRLLAERGVRVFGVDYSVPSLRKARERSDSSIGWVAADATCLPLADGTFDGAICFGVTQALASSIQVVEELNRVVRPGGEVWIDALNAWCWPHLWERISRRIGCRPTHTRYEFPRSLLSSFRRTGFTDIRIIWIPIMPARHAHHQWIMELAVVRWVLRCAPPLAALLSHAFVVHGVKEDATGPGQRV